MHNAAGIECSDDEALNTEGNDEEVSRWEQEQIRKGISIPQVSSFIYFFHSADIFSLLVLSLFRYMIVSFFMAELKKSSHSD